MEFLNEIRTYLEKLKYPNISIKSDSDIADIFCPQNIHFFAHWVLKLLNVEIPFEITDPRCKIFLADTIAQFGFCKTSERELFINGDVKLPASTQVIFYFNLLNYII